MLRKVLQAIFIFYFFLFTFSFLLSNPIFAAEEFATSYDVLYDVDEKGITTVTEKINLKNLTSEYYANQFKLTIGATDIFDIKAVDPAGPMEVIKEQTDNTTSLSVKFNQQVAGIGKSLSWTMSFKSKDFAEKVGKVWEVRAPKIVSATNLEDYNLILAVPESFGQPSQITPAPKSQSLSLGKIFLTFDKNQLQSSGLSANFGSIQLFDFDLAYHLENKNLVPILTNIALPPDTAYQDVIYQRINPAPLNVTLDDDGNYLAWFRLNRNQKLDVRVFGSAKLYTDSKAQNPTLDGALRKKYTSADKYWEKDHPQIIAKLNEILGQNPPESNEEKTRLIYRFVVNHLKYDPSRLKGDIDRLGAVTALNNPDSAVCMEFTDLFIALTRAAGIPSRELDGYAYTVNSALRPLSLTKDILHAWPEYWDEKRGWVMVDPTWENTTGGVNYFSKLDLNHLTFAIKGSSSVYPVPAGSYKYTGEDSRDVKVSLTEIDFLGKPQINVSIDVSNPILSGFPGQIKVKITNTGNALFPSASLSVMAGTLSLLDGSGQKLGPVLPFGSSEFDYNIRTKSLFDSFDDTITVSVGAQKFTKDVFIRPFVLFQTAPFTLTVVIVLMVVSYIVILTVHIRKKRL